MFSDATIVEIVAASVAPAVFISAGGLMLVAFLARHTTLTGRLRELHEESLSFTDKALREDCDYYRTRARLAFDQSKGVFERVRVVNKVLVTLLASQLFFLLTCAFLGGGAVWPAAFMIAIVSFGLALVVMFAAVWIAFRGLRHSISAIRSEEVITEHLLGKLEEKHTD